MVFYQSLFVGSFEFMIDSSPIQSGSLTFRPLLTQPNEHFPPHSLVTSLSPLPPHPFHFLLTTSEGLVILDSRQPQTPLLAAEHELPDSTRFISTVHTTSDDSIRFEVNNFLITKQEVTSLLIESIP